MKGGMRQSLRYAGTALALGLLIYLLASQGWAEVWKSLRTLAWWRLALALGLMFGSRLMTIGRWHMLLVSGGVKARWRDTAQLTFAGLFAANFLPTTIGGDVLRMAGAVLLGYDTAVSAASLVADRLVGMAGMTTALPLGVSSLFSYLAGQAAATAPMGFAGWLGRFWRAARAWLGKMLRTLGVWLRQPKALVKAYAFTLGHMLCLFTAIWILFDGMGQTISLWQVAGLWSFTYFVTQVPVTINGLGLQEVSFTFIFTNMAGVSMESALSMAVIIRVLTMLASTPGAAFAPGLIRLRRESSMEIPPEEMTG